MADAGAVWAGQWWDSSLSFDGHTILATDHGLGRLLRDRPRPRTREQLGGWSDWAWQALTSYADIDARAASDVAEAMLWAAGTGSPAFDDVRSLAELDVAPGRLVRAAHALADQRLACGVLVVALSGILAP